MSAFADANPTKEFFLEMFTRDISLIDSILDLVDNSIDALISTYKIDIEDITSTEYSTKVIRHIEIKVNSTSFIIRDNCGGIDINDAEKYVFRFGKPREREQSNRKLGVYGIGLKRALFKIGNKFKVTSVTTNNGFIVNVDLVKWRETNEGSWQFPLSEIPGVSEISSAGTEIVITDLHENVKSYIIAEKLNKALETKISSVYSYFINRFVIITLNGKTIEPVNIIFGQSESIVPARHKFTLKEDDKSVNVELIAGVLKREDKWEEKNAGWNVICNGRMILSRDRTETTGWGSLLPLFVPKYRGFAGIARFTSDDPMSLPWTTTKHDLNRESKIFLQALNEIKIISRPVLTWLDKNHSDDISRDERQILREITKETEPIDSRELFKKVDSTFQYPLEQKRENQTTSIQYSVKRDDMERIKKHIRKRLSNSEIGRLTFDYYMNHEVAK